MRLSLSVFKKKNLYLLCLAYLGDSLLLLSETRQYVAMELNENRADGNNSANCTEASYLAFYKIRQKQLL